MISSVVRACFPVAAQVVATKAEEINKLNVFPVPDGDTGTNMSLTLKTVVKEVESLPADASMEEIAKAITHGSLMGARGNSGVITSQILRGLAEGLTEAKNQESPTIQDVAHAFRKSVKVAFKAVRKPVEGTILTVLKDVSACADRLEKTNMSTRELLDALVVEAYESVARTPDLLPVLKENGVVDSGAFGFASFFEGFVNAVNGEPGKTRNFKTSASPENDSQAQAAHAALAGKIHIEQNDDWTGSEFKYCNEFLFEATSPDFDADKTRDFLGTLGDCELIVGDYPNYKIHVHSNNPDKVLAHMLQFGQVYNVFIHNMDLEAQERTQKIAAEKRAAESEGASSTETTKPLKELGLVAVAAGEGQEEILRSLGVDVVVRGGQTMNPSTADILSAVEEAHAKQVLVLPNNSNIRMAAEAAASAATECKVGIVPTKTVLQAFSALMVFDEDADLDENIQEMTEALAAVRGGEVTQAVRESQAADGSPIHAGDVIGIQDDSIDIVGSSIEQVTLDLIASMQEQEEGDTLTLLAGSDLNDEDLEVLTEKIEEAHPDLELDVHRGEQPLYPVIFSIE